MARPELTGSITSAWSRGNECPLSSSDDTDSRIITETTEEDDPVSTTTNLQFLQRNLLDDEAAARWGTAELYDAMAAQTNSYSAVLGRVGATASYFESGRRFWVPKGTAVGEAPDLQVYFNGTLMGTADYSVDYFNGRISLTVPSTSLGDKLTATFYACNLWQVAADVMMKQLHSTAASISGGETEIKLGPLAKREKGAGSSSTANYVEKINAFQRFAQLWRLQNQRERRVRM